MNVNKLSRRDLFKALAAGAVMTAGGLWLPGQKLISIPEMVSLTLADKIDIFETGVFNSVHQSRLRPHITFDEIEKAMD